MCSEKKVHSCKTVEFFAPLGISNKRTIGRENANGGHCDAVNGATKIAFGRFHVKKFFHNLISERL